MKRFLITLLLIFSARSSSSAQAVSAAPPEQFAEFGDFKLHNGGVIRDFRIGFRTIGILNAARSNAVLWPTSLGGRTEDLLPYVGPANVADTDRYFVILVESIGNGISSSPSNSKSQPLMRFPEFSVRDMVESEYRLVTEKLGLTHLHAVMGVSMGGMQTFAWAVTRPDFLDIAIPMNGSPQSTTFDKLLWTADIDAIELDPAWNKGNPVRPLTKGPALAAEIDSMNVTSPGYRVSHTGPRDSAAFLAELRKNAPTDGGSAANQIRQRQAILSLDLPAELGIALEETARRVRAKTMVIVSLQDHMVNPEPADRFAKSIGAPVVELDTPCGHNSLGCISIGPVVAQFLSDPSSVRSQTLHEPDVH
jgi:homoserine O-acetyltransferase